jgi:prepilin peptidase CpaA
MSAVEAFAVVTVCVACLYDVSTSRIPNALTFTTAALGLLFHVLAPAGAGWSHALLGLIAGLAVFFPMFALGAMGAGDVKLMAAVGAWIGALSILNVALYGSVAGGVLAVIVALRQRYLTQALTNVKMLLAFWWVEGIKPFPALTLESKDSLRLPYALAIAAGLAVTLWQR